MDYRSVKWLVVPIAKSIVIGSKPSKNTLFLSFLTIFDFSIDISRATKLVDMFYRSITMVPYV